MCRCKKASRQIYGNMSSRTSSRKIATPNRSTTTTSPVIQHEVARNRRTEGTRADDHVTDGDRELQHSEEPSSTCANQVARISPGTQHRLRLTCFPSSVLRNLQMQHQMRVGTQECQRPKSAWSGSSMIQGSCTKSDFEISQTRFLWTHRASAPSLSGQVTPAISVPTSGESHRARGERSWLRWFLFGWV